MMKSILIITAMASGLILHACKKPVPEQKSTAPIASEADTTDGKGWNGLGDNIDPASWQAKELE